MIPTDISRAEQIIGQLLFYEQTRPMLARMRLDWFENATHRKIIEVMTKLYFGNNLIDLLSVSQHFKNKNDKIYLAELFQNVYELPMVENYLPELEQKFLHRQFVDSISKLSFTMELTELVTQTQNIIDATRFSSIKDPKNIVDVTNDAVDTLVQSIERGDRITGLQTGWQSLDRILGGWNKGDLVVVAARPAQGKTALALSLITEFAKLNGKGLFLSLEMSNEQLARRYISLIGNLPNWKVRSGSLSQYEIDSMVNVAKNQTIKFYIDDDPNMSIQQIKSKAKLHKAKHGLQLLLVDYIQLIKGTKQNREQEIAEISRNLKLLAKELEITVIILAQLSRKCEERQDKRPMLSDIRESGSIEQDADVVLFPFRPCYYTGEKVDVEQAELIVAKNRHGECFTIPVHFTGNLTKYTEI